VKRVSSDDAGERRAELDREVVGDLDDLEDRYSRFLGRHPRAARAVTLADAVVRRQGAQQLSLVAAGAAFWLVISASPIAIAVVTLYGLVVDPGQVAGDLGDLVDATPASLGSIVREQLERVAAADATGLTIGLVVSIALAMWSASAGIYHLDCAIRDAYGLPRQRYVEARARSLTAAAVLTVGLGAVALALAAALARSRGLLALLVGAPTVFVGVVAVVAGLYRFAVGRPMRLRALLPGAVAAATAMVVLLAGLGLYASASTHFTAVYGAFGAAVIGMTAAYLAVYAALLGAVLNVEFTRTGSEPSSGDPSP
jgi:membrane protein